MRILSSAAKCRRVARRMSLTTRSAGAFVGPDFCLIFAPSKGYDESEILPSSTRPFCLTIPDGKHPAYHFKRIGLEAGPLSQWLFSALAEASLPVICVETRHMQAVLKAQINKTDRNDARGIAQMMRSGVYRPVHVKTLRSQKQSGRIDGENRMRSGSVASASRSRTRGWRTATGPIPVITSRSGRWPNGQQRSTRFAAFSWSA